MEKKKKKEHYLANFCPHLFLSLRGSTMKNTSTPKILKIYKKRTMTRQQKVITKRETKETKKVGDWKGNGEIKGGCTDEKESDEGKKKKAVRINNTVKWMAPSQRPRATVVWTGEYSVPRNTVGSVTPSWRSPLVSFSSPSRSILEHVRSKRESFLLSLNLSVHMYIRSVREAPVSSRECPNVPCTRGDMWREFWVWRRDSRWHGMERWHVIQASPVLSVFPSHT